MPFLHFFRLLPRPARLIPLLPLLLAILLPACTTSGPRGTVSFGRAHPPPGAPDPVKHAMHAGNRIVGKPYKWGGGHGSFEDTGYDCSGTVSYVLGRAGLLSSPMDSRGLMRYGARGKGRWITVYARSGHAFMVVAGVRFDTTGRSERDGPGWRRSMRPTSGYVARHPPGL